MLPAATTQRERLATVLALALAVAFAALVAVQPLAALAVAGVCLAIAIALLAPVATLTLILFLTMIVPAKLLSAYDTDGPIGRPGIYFSVVLLFVGLARAAPELMRMHLDRRRGWAALAVMSLLAIVLLQMLHGFAAGWDHREAGGECRALLYLGTFLLALPILADERARGRLLKALVGLGLLLGLWGIAQWVFSISFPGDFGVRPGVRGTSHGHGQVQGGLFLFPVAIVIAVAFLVSGQARSKRDIAALVTVVALNGISLLLTYERTFWVAAAIGTAFVAAKAGRQDRTRAIAMAAPVLAGVALSLWALEPNLIRTARERLSAARNYAHDSAYHYRVVESRHVLAQIRRHPVIGSGLGATIFWGQPWANKPPRNVSYNHVGYLALAWKLGIPAALLLIALIVSAIATRGPPLGDPLFAAFRNGCRGGLLALLVTGIAFPCFVSPAVTGLIGVMLAVCATPRTRERAVQTRLP
jgi:hypothetical protein